MAMASRPHRRKQSSHFRGLVKHITKLAVSSSHECEVDVSSVVRSLRRSFQWTGTENDIEDIARKYAQYFELNTQGRTTTIKARTSLGFCEVHMLKNGTCSGVLEEGEECTNLHMCKYFMLSGRCKFNDSCLFGHDLNTDHNQKSLSVHLLDHLSLEDIRTLLKRSRSRSTSQSTAHAVPQVCKFYNVQSGCSREKNCQHLHVCRHYLLDKCTFGPGCKRSHNIYDDQPKNILEKYGLDVARSPKETLTELRCLLQPGGSDNAMSPRDGQVASSRPSTPDTPSQGTKRTNSTSGEDGDLEICIFFLRGKCGYGGNCRNFHPPSKQMYHWQYQQSTDHEWTDLVDSVRMKTLETFYSDPTKGLVRIKVDRAEAVLNFDKMIMTIGKQDFNVRRLSTRSSVLNPSHLFTTSWGWYWKDDAGKWTEYGKQYTSVAQPRRSLFGFLDRVKMSGTPSNETSTTKSSVTSTDIELEFLQNPKGTVSFSTSSWQYKLDFSAMHQVNLRIGTTRNVRRRPRAETDDPQPDGAAAGHSEAKQSTSKLFQAFGLTVPKHWDMNAKSDNDCFQLVQIGKRDSATKEEYRKVERKFHNSMPESMFSITSIKRVQNLEIWDSYARKKTWMEKRAGGKVLEEELFHGTRQNLVSAVCQQGFDPRVSGMSSGTAYGKGSYFASEAMYSRNYTDSYQLFLVRVLVGSYTVGKSSYVRPPPKDPTKPYEDLFDSCVDKVENPKVYVVFKSDQAYPEYLIDFSKSRISSF